ncbi:MAG: KpsF/GutQ family sugar-phosphate isomerase [Pirellulaceae bacterium]
MQPLSPSGPAARDSLDTPLAQVRFVRDVIAAEAEALLKLSKALGLETSRAAELTANCQGAIVVTGMGKAGLIGRKLVATLSSTGSPAHFLHPAEAIHGDLGMVRQGDLVWALSNSGRSDELIRILPALREQADGLIAFTGDTENPLAAKADCVIAIGKHEEACPLGLAPSTTTTAMLAVGDAVALLASRLRGFSRYDFARFHPGGSLGRKLTRVDQLMRPLESCRIAPSTASVRETMLTTSTGSRRVGAVMLTDVEGRLAGLFTDSDFARLLQSNQTDPLDRPIAEVMTRNVQTIPAGTLLNDAIAVLSGQRISELPVLDDDARPLGLLDITDVVSLTETPPATFLPIRDSTTSV